jgi:hypothetical protein
VVNPCAPPAPLALVGPARPRRGHHGTMVFESSSARPTRAANDRGVPAHGSGPRVAITARAMRRRERRWRSERGHREGQRFAQGVRAPPGPAQRLRRLRCSLTRARPDNGRCGWARLGRHSRARARAPRRWGPAAAALRRSRIRRARARARRDRAISRPVVFSGLRIRAASTPADGVRQSARSPCGTGAARARGRRALAPPRAAGERGIGGEPVIGGERWAGPWRVRARRHSLLCPLLAARAIRVVASAAPAPSERLRKCCAGAAPGPQPPRPPRPPPGFRALQLAGRPAPPGPPAAAPPAGLKFQPPPPPQPSPLWAACWCGDCQAVLRGSCAGQDRPQGRVCLPLQSPCVARDSFSRLCLGGQPRVQVAIRGGCMRRLLVGEREGTVS